MKKLHIGFISSKDFTKKNSIEFWKNDLMKFALSTALTIIGTNQHVQTNQIAWSNKYVVVISFNLEFSCPNKRTNAEIKLDF